MVHEGVSNSAPTDASSNISAVVSFDGVRIKQEKITPPPSPSHASLNGTYIEAAAADDKSSIGPVKSSSEILGELFQVFSAEVPEDLVPAAGSRKKHKKEKKSKKDRHKERDAEEGGDDPGAADDPLMKHKKKHRHGDKEKKRSDRKSVQENEDHLHTAKLLERKRRFEAETDFLQEPPKMPKTSEPVVTAQPIKPQGAKIVFKSLKDSALFKNASTSLTNNAPSSSQSNRRNDDDDLSDLSLSDEETYLRERDTFWTSKDRQENPFYASQSKVQIDEPT